MPKKNPLMTIVIMISQGQKRRASTGVEPITARSCSTVPKARMQPLHHEATGEKKRTKYIFPVAVASEGLCDSLQVAIHKGHPRVPA